MVKFLNSVSAVFVIFLLLSVGYMMGKLKWMTASDKKFISKFEVNLAVPVNCVVGVLNNFSREDLTSSGIQLVCAALVVVCTVALSCGVATLLKLPKNRWGIFVAMAGIPNTMFIGLPMTQQLFGEVSLPYMMTYYLATSVFTQTVGVALCQMAGEKGGPSVNPLKAILELFKKPPVLGIILAIFLLLTGLRPPRVIMDAAKYLSGTVTPLALMYCGFILYEVGLKNLRFMPGLPTMLLIRLAISPLICVGLCMALGITGLTREVYIIMAALPVVSQVTVMAGLFGADEQYAAVGSSMSLLGIFITIPIIMTLI